MCLLDLFQGMEGGWGTVDIAWAFLGGFLLVRSNTKKWGDHRNKKIINKSGKALILPKKVHQGLLKLRIALRGSSTVGEKMGLQKGNFVWSRKITFEEACQDLLKYCVSFGWGLEFFNEKNREATEGRVKILWGGPIETVEWIWWIFGGCLIGFCHKTAEIHFRCIQLIN